MAKNSSVGYESYCSRVVAVRQQLSCGFQAYRIDKVRGDLGKRLKNEPACRKRRVRYGQTRLLNNLISKEQNVDIQRTRTFDPIPGAALYLLYLKADRQQFIGRQVRVCAQNGIEKPGLVRNLAGLR